MKRIKNIFQVIFIFFLLDSFSYSETLELIEKQLIEKKSQLIKIQKEIKNKKKEIIKREKIGKTLLNEIKIEDDKIDIMNKELSIYRWNLNKNSSKKNKIISKLKLIEHELNKKRELLSKRLRIIYKEKSKPYLRAAFSANSFYDGIKKIKYMNKIAKQDWRLIENVKKRIVQLKKNENILIKVETKIKLYQEKAFKKNQQIKNKKLKKKALYKKIQIKKELLKKVALELKKNYTGLKIIIEKLSRRKKSQPRSLSDFAKKRGKFLWPINGRILSPYGKVKDKKIDAYLFNNGINIEASDGNDIGAIYKGEVIYANQVNGYGRLIIIDHGDYYYSIYAHLKAIIVSVGDKIVEGQKIAKVAEDTALTEESSLYFEIRHHGKSQNPITWLKSVKSKKEK